MSTAPRHSWSGRVLWTGLTVAILAAVGPVPLRADPPKTVDLQTDTDAVRIDGQDLHDDPAYRTATCDINGDGVLDLVIGDPQGDGPGNTRLNDCGEVSVIYGHRRAWTGPLALATERDIRFIGQHPSDQLGDNVACGDINGDGFDDIVMCAPWADRNRPGGWTSGQAHVVFGSPDLSGEIDLEVDPGLVINGEYYGGALCENPVVADINGDGTDDLILDDPNAYDRLETYYAGRVYVLFGRENWPAAIDLRSFHADVLFFSKPYDSFASDMAAGDLDHDGTAELLISARFGDGPRDDREDCGDIYVFRGRSDWPLEIDTATDWPDLLLYGADAGDNLTRSGALAVGDLDQDGTAEAVTGTTTAWGRNNTDKRTGETRLVEVENPWPPAIDMGSSVDAVIYGADPGDRAAAFVVLADVDGDRSQDLLMDAYAGDGPDESRPDAGEISAFLGALAYPLDVDLGTGQEDLLIYGPTEGESVWLSTAGDINGDGLDEIVAHGGASYADDIWPKFWLISPYDVDGDGITQLPDNCPLVYNPDQADTNGDQRGDACQEDWDGDGIADGADCAPADPAGGAPGPVGGLVFEAGGTSAITWSPATLSDRYDVSRGGLADLDGSDYGACRNDDDPDTTDTRFEDGESPAAGAGFFYLVRSRNDVCGLAGSWGDDSAGTERVNGNPSGCP